MQQAWVPDGVGYRVVESARHIRGWFLCRDRTGQNAVAFHIGSRHSFSVGLLLSSGSQGCGNTLTRHAASA